VRLVGTYPTVFGGVRADTDLAVHKVARQAAGQTLFLPLYHSALHCEPLVCAR